MIVERFKTPFAEQPLYQCAKCGEVKPSYCFTQAIRNTYRNGLQSYCKDCMYNYGKQHRKDNLELYRKRQRESYSKSFEGRIRALLKVTSSDRSALDFDWCWEQLKQQDFKCCITGIPLTYEVRSPTTVSIDRIDPAKGYTKDNVRFVCWWINAAMGNWGLDKLKGFIKEWNDNQQI